MDIRFGTSLSDLRARLTKLNSHNLLLLLFLVNSYTVGPILAKKVSFEATSVAPTLKPTLEKKMDDAVRDLKIGYLPQVSVEIDDTTFNDLWNKLVTDYSDSLQLYMAKLKYLDENSRRHENLDAIIVAANDIISRVSEDDLAKCLGRRVDMDNGDSIQVRESKHYQLQN
jgi:hypothetical protein